MSKNKQASTNLPFKKAAVQAGLRRIWTWKGARNTLVLRYHPEELHIKDRYEVVPLSALKPHSCCLKYKDASTLRSSLDPLYADSPKIPKGKRKRGTSPKEKLAIFGGSDNKEPETAAESKPIRELQPKCKKQKGTSKKQTLTGEETTEE